MGAPMAGHLVRAGHTVHVWNRTASKLVALIDSGALAAASIEDVSANSDVVFLCVSRNEDVIECVTKMLPTSRETALFVDHSTIEPSVAVTLHDKAAAQGRGFLDAPVTGGSMGAQKGQLTVFCGGEAVHFDRALPILKAYSKTVSLVGGAGAGQTMKLANQIAVGGALLALCESLSFAKKAGLDIGQTRELLGTGAAGSWAFENYGPKIVSEDWSPGFSITNQRKDFSYTLRTAQNIDAAVPGTTLVDRILAVLDESGHGDWTTAALYSTLLSSGFSEWM